MNRIWIHFCLWSSCSLPAYSAVQLSCSCFAVYILNGEMCQAAMRLLRIIECGVAKGSGNNTFVTWSTEKSCLSFRRWKTGQTVRCYPLLWPVWGNKRWRSFFCILLLCDYFRWSQCQAAALPKNFCPIKRLEIWSSMFTSSVFVQFFFYLFFFYFWHWLKCDKTICFYMFSREFSTAEFLKILFLHVQLGHCETWSFLSLHRWDCSLPAVYFPFSVRIIICFPPTLRPQICTELELPALMLQKMNEQTNSITKVHRIEWKSWSWEMLVFQVPSSTLPPSSLPMQLCLIGKCFVLEDGKSCLPVHCLFLLFFGPFVKSSGTRQIYRRSR